MLKTIICALFLFFAVATVRAQSTDSVYNRYLDFNLARLQGDQDKVLELGEALIPDTGKLPQKARINFFFSAGKMYEDNDQPDKALTYYEKVAAAVPYYYVVHRALGYLYLDKLKATERQLNAPANDAGTNARLFADYTRAARIVLAHLEKAQACDHSDDTLAIIKLLYKNIKDTQGLSTLDGRLKQLNKNCIDILADN